MAIQPIDLQTIFSQAANVGKLQAAVREGQQAQFAHQQAQAQKKVEEDDKAVNEAQEMGKEAGTIKEHQGSNQQADHGDTREKQQEEEVLPEEQKPEWIRNPALGRNIDISG